MKDFSSGENEFVLFDFKPGGTAGGPIFFVIIDAPFNAEIHSELMSFWRKDIKIKITDEAGKRGVETEFYVKNIPPKDYKEGPRMRIILRQPYESDTAQKIVKLYQNNIKFEFKVIQSELDMEDDEE